MPGENASVTPDPKNGLGGLDAAAGRWKKQFRRWRNKAINWQDDFLPADEVPFDIDLRKPNIFTRVYEKLRPLRYVVKCDYRYQQEFLYDFMPIGLQSYLGRGTYKYVYRLPWDEVVKIGKPVLPSNPIFGSLYQRISREPKEYLSVREHNLMEHIAGRYLLSRNRRKIRRKFYRLALEKLHHAILKSRIPDLLVPTSYFMAIKFREHLFTKKVMPVYMPADVQPLLYGKHLKQFVTGAAREKQGPLMDALRPKWRVVFDGQQFGAMKSKIIDRLKEDLRRITKVCDELASRDGLILDMHAENIIITLPDFHIRLFDFHLFDTHLYEPEERGLNPEREHIQMIEMFIDALDSEILAEGTVEVAL